MDSLGSHASSGGGGPPKHLGQGLLQGGTFFTKVLLRGVTGVFDRPARGARKGAVGFASGMATGVGGLVAAPLVAALGGASKVAESIDATTHLFDYLLVDCRVRPRRNFGGWGALENPISVPCIKGIGIRVHSLNYVVVGKTKAKAEGKKKIVITGADDTKFRVKSKKATTTQQSKGGKDGEEQIEFTVVFEDTMIIRSSNLQVYDELRVEIWDKKLSHTTPLAVTFLRVEELLADIKKYSDEKMAATKASLSQGGIDKLLFSEVKWYYEGLRSGDGGERNSAVGTQDRPGDISVHKRPERTRSFTAQSFTTEQAMLDKKLSFIAPAVNDHMVYIPKKKKDSIMSHLKAGFEEVKKGVHDAAVESINIKPSSKSSAKGSNSGLKGRTGSMDGSDYEALEGLSSGTMSRETLRLEGQPFGFLKISVFPVHY